MSSIQQKSYKQAEADKESYLLGTPIVLDGKTYKALPRTIEMSSNERNNQTGSDSASRHNSSSQQVPSPTVSISDLVLNNVTYDAILASSSKNLRLNPDEEESPDVPLGDDARTPPNSPSLSEPPQGFGSLLGASVQVMSSDPRK